MKYRLIVCLSLLLYSCSEDLEEINTNPNDPTIVKPDYLFTTSLFESLKLYGGEMDRVVFFNYTHHFSGFQGEFQRYTYSNSSNNSYWEDTYIRCLQPLHQIEQEYQDNPDYRNRVAIARIWKDYIFFNTTSIWGSVPKSEALSGEPSIPYEREEEIYYALLDELKTLTDAMDLEGDTYEANADKIYQGDLLNWKKFANTLRLKIAMHILNDPPNGNPEVARQVVSEIYLDEQNTITQQDETAAENWGTTSDTWSHLYDEAVYNYAANLATLPVLNESLVYYTKPYADPRLGVYGQLVKEGPREGTYFGQNISYGGGEEYSGGKPNPHQGMKQENYSQIGERFLKPDAEYVFLSYAQSCFLKAEAALKGWWGTDARTYYEEGIQASFDRYDLTPEQANEYMQTPGIAWGTASDTTGRAAEFQDWLQITSSYVSEGDYFRQIVMQHWLAIPMQGVDAWSLLRRTRVLDFQPQFATYNGEYAYLPNRILYPTDEYQTNTAEVEKAVNWLPGPDDLFTKLWFAQPIKKNPYLPH